MSDSHGTKCLGDYVELQRGNTYKSALLGQAGPVLLGLGSIARNGGFKPDNLKTYGGYSDPRILLRPGEIYVSLKDVTQSADLLGAVSRVPSFIRIGRLTQDTVKLCFKSEDAPKDYIYWLLRTPTYRAYCKAHATSTTNLGLSRDDFFSFPVPPLTKARAGLVALIQSIEDKIELNRKITETLETMARAIFMDWFVHFGPTRAKAEGRSPPGLSTSVAALFPDSLDADDKPIGWPIGRLDDLLLLQRGFDLPTTQRMPGHYVVMAASGPSGTHSEFMVRGPGVTTGRSGVLGNVFFIDEDFWPLNTSLWVKEFRAATPLYAYFILQTLDLRSFNAGSAVPTLNRNHVHGLPAIIPPKPLIERFESLAMTLFARRGLSEIESGTLSRLRDMLLPSLVSGEIRLRDAEKIVEAAA